MIGVAAEAWVEESVMPLPTSLAAPFAKTASCLLP